MSRSSKNSDGWPPRWLTKTTAAERARGDGEQCANFIDQLCKITKDTIAGSVGEQIRTRQWQRMLISTILARRADDRRKFRTSLVGMPRKNGKSALGAGIGLHGLLFGPQGGEVYSCAAEKEQAKIVFNMAKRMVELEPDLADEITCYRDVLEVKSTGSIYRALSAEAYSKEGLNPSLVIFDEVHAQPNRELWDVMALASGARVDPLLLGITTAGVMTDSTGLDSLCYGLYQHGREVVQGLVEDPSFCFVWWEPTEGVNADHRDPQVWQESNPGFDDIVAAEDFAASLPKTHENEFRIKRTNVFTAGQTAWLPFGAWGECVSTEPIPDGTPVVLAFDGSFNNDSTALVVATLGEHPHLDVAECWERPSGAQPDWAVPILDVEEAIRQACRRWQVRSIQCDPFRWARTFQVLEAERLPLVEFPQTPARMVPATQRFYEAVINKTLTHSGDTRLARHMGAVVIKTDSRGSRLAKESKNSARKIDLAICAVMAHEAATSTLPDREFFGAWG